MCLEIANMLFGPSDPFAFPICLSALDSHRFDSCLNQLFISKFSLPNKYFIGLQGVLSVSKSATYTFRIGEGTIAHCGEGMERLARKELQNRLNGERLAAR
jgi:hypothetical protein